MAEQPYGTWGDWLLCFVVVVLLKAPIPFMPRNPEGHSPRWWKKHPEAVRPPVVSKAKGSNKGEKRTPETEGITKKDWTILLLGVPVAIVLGLVTPRLTASFEGRAATFVLLTLMVMCPLPSVWALTKSTILRCIGFLVILTLAFILGWYVWPYTLTVSHKNLRFRGYDVPDAVMPNQIQTLTLKNRSDDDVYSSELDLTVSDQSVLDKISVESDEQNLGGTHGSRLFSDVKGVLCPGTEKYKEPLIILSFERLTPSESRSVAVKYFGSKPLNVSAKTGFFTTEQQEIDLKTSNDGTSGSASSRMKWNNPTTDDRPCKPFNLPLNGKVN